MLNKESFINVGNKGSNVSIKIVIPTSCNAHCAFCFNKLTQETAQKNFNTFIGRLYTTLDSTITMLENKGRTDISLDITGNEPTFNPQNLAKALEIIGQFKNRVNKVVLTTNGFRIKECIESFKGVIDFVNISTHHYDASKRAKVFNTSKVLSDSDYTEITKSLNELGIKCTAVAVIALPIEEGFQQFVYNFVDWAKAVGFSSIRFRSNFNAKDEFIIDYFQHTNFPEETQVFDVIGLYTKILMFGEFEVRFLLGVPDLTEHVIGVEGVIDDDGRAYVDYNKRFRISEHDWVYDSVYFKDNENFRRVYSC